MLWVEDGVFASAALNAGRPSPMRIFAALAEQLKGEYWVETTPEGKSRLSLRLPIHSGTQGPAIRAPRDLHAYDLSLSGKAGLGETAH